MPTKAIKDVELTRRRLVRVLEVADDPDPGLLRDISDRRAELTAEHAELAAELRRLAEHVHQQPNPDLLDSLPVGPCDIAALPEAVARRLFEAFRLEIHYDKQRHTACFRITLTGDTLDTADAAASDAVSAGERLDWPPAGRSSHPFPSVSCPRADSNRGPRD